MPSKLSKAVLLTTIVTAACSVYSSSYSLTNSAPRPASLLVATKIQRPLYLIVDPTRVKDSWEMSGDGGRFVLKDFQTFVRRDLKVAMQAFFERVEVLNAGDPLPSGPHLVGDVKVDKVALNDLITGELTYTAIEMTWGFALRPSESADYAFSFAGTATSGRSYPTFEDGCARMIESAVGGLLTKWTEKDATASLRSL